MKPTTHYLGIGSNTERVHNLSSCLNYLARSFRQLQISPIYRSPAYGFAGQDFYNLVVRLDSAYTPHQLKNWLQKIEDIHGRDRAKPRYSDRTLDIDLLLCNDLIIDDGKIQIPRREILQRKYVLKPLQDLAPDLMHPVAEKRLSALWRELNANDPSALQTVRSTDWLPKFHVTRPVNGLIHE